MVNSKCWGLVFTWLASSAIHIGHLETIDANSVICALRHFFVIRCPALRLRCDRGTNFVGAKTHLTEMNQSQWQSTCQSKDVSGYLILPIYPTLVVHGNDR